MHSASSSGCYSSDTHQGSKYALVGLGTQQVLLYEFYLCVCLKKDYITTDQLEGRSILEHLSF